MLEEVSEGFHDGRSGYEWGHLVHEAVPRPDVRDGRLCRHFEVSYGCQSIVCWPVALPAQVVSDKLHLSKAEPELLGVKCDAPLCAQLEKIICVPEGLFYSFVM